MFSSVDTDFAKQIIPECHPLYSKFYKTDHYNCTLSRVHCRERVILSMLRASEVNCTFTKLYSNSLSCYIQKILAVIKVFGLL